MTTEAAFLATLADDPTDDTTRLVFADWLDERGDPRAAWLRDPDLAPWALPELVDPVPRLLAALQQENPEARRVLLRLGAAVVPALLGMLNDETRPALVDLFHELANSDGALRVLRYRLAEDDAEVRQSGIDGVVAMGHAAVVLLPDLLRLQGEGHLPDGTLGRLLQRPGVACPPVFRYIWRACRYDDRAVAYDLFEAIERYGADPTGVDILIAALNNGGNITEYAVGAIHQLGVGVVPQVIAAFERADSDSFDWWVLAVTGFGVDAVPALLDALDREYATHADVTSSYIWMGIERSLRELAQDGQFGAHMPLVVERLTALATARPERIWEVHGLLYYCGPAARPAWPLLEPYVNAAEPHYRMAALQFQAALGEPEPLEAAIATLLDVADAEQRTAALQSLGALAALSLDRAAGLLARALTNTAVEVRLKALDILTSPTCWGRADPTAALLRAALSDPEPKVRQLAAYGLHRYPEQVAEALPELLHLFREDPDTEVRLHAAGAILKAPAEVRSPDVAAIVVAATQHPEHNLRAAADAILREWGRPPATPSN